MNKIILDNGKIYEECTKEEWKKLPCEERIKMEDYNGFPIALFKLVHPKEKFVFPVRVELSRGIYAKILDDKTTMFFNKFEYDQNVISFEDLQKVLQEVKRIEESGGFEK